MMKRYLLTRYFLLSGFVALIAISCSKNDSDVTPVLPHISHPSPTAIGAIVDSGAVSPGTRVMKMELNPQYFTLYGNNDQISYVTAKAEVAFYVNNDGLIPSGEYRFSTSDGKAPFTFDSAQLAYVPGNNTQLSTTDQVVDGKITVSKQENLYVFSMQINLASGMTTSQIYTGVFDYADLMN